MFSKYLYLILPLLNLVTSSITPNLTYLYKNWQTGDGTYYGYHSQGGACGLDPTPLTENGTMSSVAMNAHTYYGSHVCGMCLEVIADGKGLGTKPFPKTMKVIVKDLCPECKKGDLDFAINGDGRWNIRWKAINCPVKQGVQFMFEGSNPWYIKLQVRNTAIPITKMEIWNKKWNNMIKEMWGFWLAEPGSGPYYSPIKVRMTSILGEIKIANITNITSNKIIQNTNIYFTKLGAKN